MHTDATARAVVDELRAQASASELVKVRHVLRQLVNVKGD